MNPFDFLRIQTIGRDTSGRKVRTRPSIRWFLVALLVGNRPVLVNARFTKDGVFIGQGALVYGCEFDGVGIEGA